MIYVFTNGHGRLSVKSFDQREAMTSYFRGEKTKKEKENPEVMREQVYDQHFEKKLADLH